MKSLNRGAGEHKYLPRTVLDETIGARRYGKGYPRRSVKTVRSTLGMRENTRMTVAPSDELFILTHPFTGD